MAATQIFWQIPELIMLVAEACVDPGPPPVITRTLVGRGAPHWRKGLGTIYALARTCQRSFYACIPVLWRTQFGIEKLACCLPPGVWRAQFSSTDEAVSDPAGCILVRYSCHLQ